MSKNCLLTLKNIETRLKSQLMHPMFDAWLRINITYTYMILRVSPFLFIVLTVAHCRRHLLAGAEPKTELIGEPTQHVKAGSRVKLRCIISQALDPPVFINWFHNQKQIFLHSRKGWRTEIERNVLPIQGFSTTADTTTTTTAQIDSATTTTPPINAAANSTATSKAPVLLLATNFENEGNSTPVVQTTVRDVELTTVTPSTPLPFSRLGTDVATDLADSDNSFDFGTGNSTFSPLPTVAAPMDTVSAEVSTKVKMTHCPTTSLTITTTITMLAAVKVREVTVS